jgi:uncharacterized protein (UPF0333 family)
MMRYLRTKKGQSLLEYSLILAAIIVAIIFMQGYVRRGLQGRLRSAADDIGDQYSVWGSMNYLTNRQSNTTETVSLTAGNQANLTTVYNDITNKTGNETLPSQEPWQFR